MKEAAKHTTKAATLYDFARHTRINFSATAVRYSLKQNFFLSRQVPVRWFLNFLIVASMDTAKRLSRKGNHWSNTLSSSEKDASEFSAIARSEDQRRLVCSKLPTSDNGSFGHNMCKINWFWCPRIFWKFLSTRLPPKSGPFLSAFTPIKLRFEVNFVESGFTYRHTAPFPHPHAALWALSHIQKER